MNKEASMFVQVHDPKRNIHQRIVHPPRELIPNPSVWRGPSGNPTKVNDSKKCHNHHHKLFSKSVEAKALTTTTNFHIIKFLKSRIISRYWIPKIMISDNGTLFAKQKLK